MYDKILITFLSINSSITKFAKYNRTCNHKTQDIALNKYTEFAEQYHTSHTRINQNYFKSTD